MLIKKTTNEAITLTMDGKLVGEWKLTHGFTKKGMRQIQDISEQIDNFCDNNGITEITKIMALGHWSDNSENFVRVMTEDGDKVWKRENWQEIEAEESEMDRLNGLV